jgi:hypothetical protein
MRWTTAERRPNLSTRWIRPRRRFDRRVNEAIEAVQEPGMPLDMLSRWTRQTPLQALAVAFLVGVLFTRRR